MGVRETFADCVMVQGRDADETVTVTVPKEIADELELERGEPALWQCDEGGEFARVKRPNR
ncbi:hypothetical protein [Halovivax asiaticus]|nr:hypothetical protein [Halovivax asiaticus]